MRDDDKLEIEYTKEDIQDILDSIALDLELIEGMDCIINQNELDESSKISETLAREEAYFFDNLDKIISDIVAKGDYDGGLIEICYMDSLGNSYIMEVDPADYIETVSFPEEIDIDSFLDEE